ncbi:MAG: RNA polymerase factor sigma-54 [bacterium]
MWAQQRQEQQLVVRVDPKLVLASSILQMNAPELDQALEQELDDNPALERLEDPGSADNGQLYSSPDHDLTTISFDDMQTYQERIYNPNDENDWTSMVAAPVHLHDYLREQLLPMLPNDLHSIGNYLIEAVNEQGYLEMDVEEVALMLSADMNEVEKALKFLHMCEPAGIGARNLQECLIIQVRQNSHTHSAIAERMLVEAFELFTKRGWKRIARMFGVAPVVIEQVGKYILTLNPHPGDSFRCEWEANPARTGSSIRPDVIIRRTEQAYEVEIRGIDPAGLSVNQHYRDSYNRAKSGAMKSASAQDRAHFVEYTERAVNFINSLKQRRRTLRKIVQYLMETQEGFIATGSYSFLKSMTRLQISKELEMHESTVSRATMHKFVQLPNEEVISFDIFFTPSLRIKKAIEQILETEDPAKPFSDERIALLLKEQGINIARRTINKYRGQDKILSSRHRNSA